MDGAYILLLLRICSAHLEILGFPMAGAYLYRDIFARFKTMGRQQNLASDLGIQKKKLGVTTHFTDIFELQFGKEHHTLLCILKLFTNIVDQLSSKNAWFSPIFFLDFNNTC